MFLLHLLPSNIKKRKRTESKYGEEITSSNKLNELKEKVAMSNSKKRSIKPAKQINSTFIVDDDDDLEATTKNETKSIKKRKTEFITLSQATRAISTLKTMTPCHEPLDQNNIIFSVQSQQ